jgi:hypothetical protein
MRPFMLQLEALEKYRGKGPSEQRVTVEHIHVNAGANAVSALPRQDDRAMMLR